MDTEQSRWNEIQKIWHDNQWLYMFIGIAVGFIVSALWTVDIRKFVENLTPGAFEILFTVLVIDRLAENRARRQHKYELIWQLRNHDNGLAVQAIDQLREYGWLTDGSLAGLNLWRANFQKAWLGEADLQECDFTRVDVKDAYFEKANLFRAKGLTKDKLTQLATLYQAILPDGTKYNGCYKLPGDIRAAKRQDVDTTDNQAMADFYGVPLEIYLIGRDSQTDLN